MKTAFFGLALVAGFVNAVPKTSDPNYTACDEDNVDWGVKYTGSSSKFSFYECEDSTNSFSTSMDSLEEHDSTGKSVSANKVESFASGSNQWQWNTQEYVNYTKDNKTYDSAVCNTYNATLAVGSGVKFLFTSCLFFSTSTYTVCPEGSDDASECETYTLPSNSLKWSVYIGSWPFVTTSNTLTLEVTVQQDNVSASFSENTTDSLLYQAKIGNFDFSAPTSATVTNSTGGTSNVNTTVDCNAGNGNNQVTCTFTWKYYSGSLEYDPSVSGDNASSSNSYIQLSLLSYLIVFVFYFFN